MKKLLVVIALVAVGFSMGVAVTLTQQGVVPPATTDRSVSTTSETVVTDAPVAELPTTPPVEDWIARNDPGKLPRGAGRITGTVKTRAGAPLSSVEVSAKARLGERQARIGEREGRIGEREGRDASPDRLGLEAHLRQALLDYRWLEARAARARTGIDGTFVLDGLTAGATYDIEASHGELEFVAARGSNREGVHAGDSCDLLAIRPLRVSMTLFTPDGTLAREADIDVRGPRSLVAPWSASRPWVRVPVEGRYRFQARRGADEVSESIEVDVTEHELPDLTLQLLERLGIRGSFTDHGGAYSDGYRAYLLPIADLDTQTDADTLKNRGDIAFVEDGRFEYRDLEAGSYRVGVGRGAGPVVRTLSVEVTNGMVDAHLDLDPEPEEGTIILWALDHRGEPIANVRQVTLRHEQSKPETMPLSRRRDGSFLVMPSRRLRTRMSDEPSGDWSLEVVTPGHGTLSAPIDPRAERQIAQIHFPEAARLEVQVAGLAKSGFAEKILVGLRKPGDSTAGIPATREERGRFGGWACTPGAREIVLRLDTGGGLQGALEIGRQHVDLVSGKNSITVDLPRLYPFTVVTPGQPPGKRLELRGASGNWRKRTDRSGRTIFDSLPAGDFVIELWTADQGSIQKDITLPRDQEVRFLDG